jgi:hypothetical protein
VVIAASNPFSRTITPHEQMIYDHLLFWIEVDSPDEMLQRFHDLFIDGTQYPDAQILHALDHVVNSRVALAEFRFVLNRCCHILINRWQSRKVNQAAVLELIEMFRQVSPTAPGYLNRSRTLRRQRELVRRFIETEQYLTLNRLAQVVSQSAEANGQAGNRPLGTLIRRYPYLYEFCLLSEDSTDEQQQTVRHIQLDVQRKFELDLSQYVTYQARRSQSTADVQSGVRPVPRLIQPVCNPTLLSDEEVNQALSHYAGRIDGYRSYKDLAHNFLIHNSCGQTLQGFKDDLYEYITASVDPEYGKRQFNNQFYDYLQNLSPESNSQRLDDFLLVRMCSQILNFLVVESPSRPNHYVFVDLITNLGPVLTTGILLKIILLCRKVKPALERRFSVLFSHYEGYTRDTVEWLVIALENMNVALSAHFGSVDLSLIR